MSSEQPNGTGRPIEEELDFPISEDDIRSELKKAGAPLTVGEQIKRIDAQLQKIREEEGVFEQQLQNRKQQMHGLLEKINEHRRGRHEREFRTVEEALGLPAERTHLDDVAEEYLMYQDTVPERFEEKNRTSRNADGTLTPNYQYYAETLDGMLSAPEKTAKLTELTATIRAHYDDVMDQMGVESSAYGKSKTWIYWDIAKQRFLHQHPDQSTPNYLLADPLEFETSLNSQDVIQQMADRMVGWDTVKFVTANGVDCLLLDREHSSYQRIIELIEIGERNINDLRSYELAELGRLLRKNRSIADIDLPTLGVGDEKIKVKRIIEEKGQELAHWLGIPSMEITLDKDDPLLETSGAPVSAFQYRNVWYKMDPEKIVVEVNKSTLPVSKRKKLTKEWFKDNHEQFEHDHQRLWDNERLWTEELRRLRGLIQQPSSAMTYFEDYGQLSERAVGQFTLGEIVIEIDPRTNGITILSFGPKDAEPEDRTRLQTPAPMTAEHLNAMFHGVFRE